MAIINNDPDSMLMVTIPVAKLEDLIRAQVTLEVLTDRVKNERYVSGDDLRGMLGLPKEEDDD